MTTQHSTFQFLLVNQAFFLRKKCLKWAKTKEVNNWVPCEDEIIESRVPLTPEAVELLVENGHEVIIGSNAGKCANYSDTDYSERAVLL